MPNSFSLPNSRFRSPLAVGALIIIVLLLRGLGFSNAHADGGAANFDLQPVIDAHSTAKVRSYFILDARPGNTMQGSIQVTNSGTATGTVSLYGVDATTGQTSGTVYLSRTEAQHDVGTWLRLDTSQLTLAPGQSQVVSFQIIVPSTVRPGQHVGGIVAEGMVQVSSLQSNNLKVNVQKLTIVAVQINLPGKPIEQLVATGIQNGGADSYQTLKLGLSNTGTVMLKPYGTLQVTDARGHLLQNRSLKLNTFLPQTSINYPVDVENKALGAGNYQARLTLFYGHGHILSYTTIFTITLQQLAKIFPSYPPLQPPNNVGSFFGMLPYWQIVPGLLLLVGGLLFWGQKLYQFVAITRRRGISKKIE